jgi:peptide/nickel transport system permease protein
VAATLAVPDLIILESVLSYLGFGIQHPLVSWGMMLYTLQSSFDFNIHYQLWLFLPAVFIVLSVLSFNFLGDALRDALDPFAVHGVKEDMK